MDFIETLGKSYINSLLALLEEIEVKAVAYADDLAIAIRGSFLVNSGTMEKT